MRFTDSATCQSRLFCERCRERSGAGQRFRAELRAVYEFDGRCPWGVPWDVGQLPRWRRWLMFGDWIAWLTGKMRIRKCGGCGRRQARMNALGVRLAKWFRGEEDRSETGPT